MRAHIYQHAPFEGPGFIGEWLAEHDVEVRVTNRWESAELAELAGLDLLVVLGGPMSATEHTTHPVLAAERDSIAAAVGAGTSVLGICLGAQLVAAALGAHVYRGRAPEIGWFPVTGEPSHDGAFAFPERLSVFHWHSDTFELPRGAVRLASSELTPNQAFQFGARTIGLQCHPEMTPDAVASLVATCGGELAPAAYVQSAEHLLGAPAEAYRAANEVMADVLTYLLAGR